MSESDLHKLNIAKKLQHLNLSLNNDIIRESFRSVFDDYYFIHNALSEISLDEVDTKIILFLQILC